MTTFRSPSKRRALCSACLILQVLLMSAAALAADNSNRKFDVPEGPAAETLKVFAQQANREIMVPAESMNGLRTLAVKGEFTVRKALDLMLVGSRCSA